MSLDGRSKALLDPTGLMSYEEARVSADFRPSGRGMYSKPLAPLVGWLRFEVHNPSHQVQARVLELGSPLIDDIQAYVRRADGTVTHYSLGENTAVAARVIPYILPQVPLTLAPGDRVQVSPSEREVYMTPLTVH